MPPNFRAGILHDCCNTLASIATDFVVKKMVVTSALVSVVD